jgi:hypothetical protein
MPPESYRTLQPERVGPRLRVWDVALTVVFLVFLALFALGASYAGFFIAMVSDPCGAGNCDDTLINVGFWIGVLSPWVLLLIAVVVGVIRLARHRIAFWVPLVAAALMVAMWFVGVAVAGSGVGR